jgi:muramidase (phage lysozyme)
VTNLQAFLDMIAVSEGTAELGDRGYNVVVGGEMFDSYADHPRKKVWIKRIGKFSTAAGRYQILQRYYDHYARVLGLPDFSPESQDQIAIQMIREQHAYPDVVAGRFDDAVAKVANIWASLPGAGYGQRENVLMDLRRAYLLAGGVLT